MAKDKKNNEKGEKAPASKQLKKAKVQWEEMEREIDKEFVLLEKQGYPKDELETLRWDYRYTKLPDFKLSQEQMEYFVAVQESIAAGVDPPPPPGDISPKAAAAAAPAAPVNEEYKRKSQVDMDLVEKYLEHRVGRETRSEMSSLYKEAFGEDLLVPDKLDLTDISYAQDMTAATKPKKLSKSEILGTPEEAKPVEEAKKEEAPVVVAAPAGPKVKRPSMALAMVRALRGGGVPDFPTYDEKWWILHPFRFWVIPKRLAGMSVGMFYGIFGANLAILIVQFFPLFGIPILLRLILWVIRYIYLKFIKNRLTPAMAKMKEKAAIQPAPAAAPAAAPAPAAPAAPAPAPEPKKEPTPANAG